MKEWAILIMMETTPSSNFNAIVFWSVVMEHRQDEVVAVFLFLGFLEVAGLLIYLFNSIYRISS